MTLKEALWRELSYGLCGSGGALEGLVLPENVDLDKRNTVSSARSEDAYPHIIYRRITNGEDNQVNYARERFEIEVVGLHASSAKGDDLLEQIKDILLDHFEGKRKTIGKFDAVGAADPSGGVLVTVNYVSTVEGFDENYTEKSHIHIFIFYRVRR